MVCLTLSFYRLRDVRRTPDTTPRQHSGKLRLGTGLPPVTVLIGDLNHSFCTKAFSFIQGTYSTLVILRTGTLPVDCLQNSPDVHMIRRRADIVSSTLPILYPLFSLTAGLAVLAAIEKRVSSSLGGVEFFLTAVIWTSDWLGNVDSCRFLCMICLIWDVVGPVCSRGHTVSLSYIVFGCCTLFLGEVIYLHSCHCGFYLAVY